MKTATVVQAQANLPELLRVVEAGGEVILMRNKKGVARIVPMNEAGRVNWSDTWAKVDTIFGGKSVPGKAGSQIVIEGRR
jgi:antitoxin (DNA-binding transcriptional repressor) of toxin-antitoxin stability system